MPNDIERIQKGLTLLALYSYYGINPKQHNHDVEVKMWDNIRKGAKNEKINI